MLKKGELLAGKYEILDEVGKGGMSIVWLARDIDIGKIWAIKEIDKTTREYIATVDETEVLSEIDLMTKLDHPAMPRIVEKINERHSLFVVMDYINGTDLLKVLASDGPQPQELVVNWALQLCDIFQYLHSQDPPIIYRDLKPSNVIVTADNNIKLVDFGTARRYSENKDDTVAMGTPGYASPESESKRTDVRSDVYTIGSTMFHLLTGEFPANYHYDLPSIRTFNPALSEGLDMVIARATENNPDSRYQDVASMKAALRNYKKLDAGYFEKKKHTIRAQIAMFIVSILLMVTGGGFIVTSEVITMRNYDALLADKSPAGRVERVEKAIEIKPEKVEGYLTLIDVLAEDGFTEEEASILLSVYARGEKEVKKDEEFSHLNFEIGRAILVSYTGSSDDTARSKLFLAEEFFMNVDDSNEEEKALADSYLFFASYYKEYIVGADTLTAKEPSRGDYEKLISQMETALRDAEKYSGKDSPALMLTTCQVIVGLTDSQRENFAVSGIEKSKVDNVLLLTEERAGEISSSLETIKSGKEKLKEDIISCKGKVDSSYENVKKKEGQ